MNKIVKTLNYLQRIKELCKIAPDNKVVVNWNGNNKCEINYDEICQLIDDFEIKYKIDENFN